MYISHAGSEPVVQEKVLANRDVPQCTPALHSATYCNVIHFELNSQTVGGKEMSPVLFQARAGSLGINPAGSYKGF